MPLLMYLEVLAMQDSFLDSDSSESQLNEVSNYCNDNYDPKSEQIDEFRVSAKRIEEIMHTLLVHTV